MPTATSRAVVLQALRSIQEAVRTRDRYSSAKAAADLLEILDTYAHELFDPEFAREIRITIAAVDRADLPNEERVVRRRHEGESPGGTQRERDHADPS